ncbi:MAG: hypothetical protein EOP50_22060 [Sphingobacteriales bacterium]|nr:MAG: hypothetical protein EOP50_22060 [Sphingobacteriales bacterium]
MDEAIRSGFLCKYDYYPVLVSLNKKEMSEYISLSKRIAIMSANNSDEQSNTKLEFLLLKRKRIINKAANKLPALSNIIRDIQRKEEVSFCFTYAPAGETTGGPDDLNLDNKRMIREMQRIFQTECPNIRTHAYLGETENRAQVLRLQPCCRLCGSTPAWAACRLF